VAIDLTVAAVPVYFATMAAEKRWLDRRAAEQGESPADYTREDTIASLSMGVGSLVVPLATHAIARYVVPGEGRFGKVLVRSAIAGAVVTTIADRIARADQPAADQAGDHTDSDTQHESRARRRKVTRWAKRVARVGGVATITTGALAVTTKFAAVTEPRRMWARGQERDLGSGPLAWLAAIVGWDFIYYWNHRFMHEVRGMWAIHVVHHSSERYNLSTALRQPVADVLGVWVPYGLLARAGVRPNLISQARAINLLYQYWIHTDAIGRLSAGIESVFNTPSHHRAHHGRNPQYLDRNHGSILIVWDKVFGTFEPEDEPVVYGLTTNIESFNPAVIATHEYRDIARDVADSTTWRDRLSFALRGPGWAYEQHRRKHEEAAQVVPA